MAHKTYTFKGLAICAISVCSISNGAFAKDLVLKYDSPAQFFEEALVTGNGGLGATIYGGTEVDRISLNDITLWTGEPETNTFNPDAYTHLNRVRELLYGEDYTGAETEMKKMQGHYSQNYQPLGNLRITYEQNGEVQNYARSLNISNATAQTSYTRGGKKFEAKYFVSAPDSVIVIYLKSESAINATLRFDSLLPHSVSAAKNGIDATGYVAYTSLPSYVGLSNENDRFKYDPERGTHFNTAIRVKPINGGTVKTYDTGDLKLEGCNEVEIIIANATSFNGFDKDPVKEGRDYVAISHRIADKALSRDYNNVLADHIADYQTLFNRVQLNLGETDSETAALTTDKQLLKYRDFSTFNPELEALYFQYGRYLLISCSRTKGVPANLQGLWNESILPPWSCNYTSNINLEENYWPACTTNLSELQMPLLDFITNLQTTGTESAKTYCGVNNGWMLAHNTDIWAMTCPVGMKGGDPSWANWYLGSAWVATHIWEQYSFTGDRAMLKKYYPALKGAAEFCLNWLTEYKGELVTAPGTSPENKFKDGKGNTVASGYGTTADLAMIRECLTDAVNAANTLNTDKAFASKAQKALKKLHPYKIGSKGSLQEWYNDWEEAEPTHRHQSHLFGLYPGHHISVAATPELAKACARTLELRGNETTGWSSGWRINLQARLGDAEKSYYVFRKLLSYISPDNYRGKDALRGGGTYPNLLDAHSPFQIDGNFGGTAGIAEMLMQSTNGTITLLPALPDNWKGEGSVSGLCARGGFEVAFSWKDGKIVSAQISSKNGGKTALTYNGKTTKISLKPGETKQIK